MSGKCNAIPGNTGLGYWGVNVTLQERLPYSEEMLHSGCVSHEQVLFLTLAVTPRPNEANYFPLASCHDIQLSLEKINTQFKLSLTLFLFCFWF